jgi:Spy/CpxP family protein refolding chaperone
MNRNNRIYSAGIAAIAMIVLGSTLEFASAASDPTVGDTQLNAAPDGPRHGFGRHGAGPDGALMPLLGKLNLTDDQKAQIHTLLGNARTQARSENQGQAVSLAALGNPADPQHDAAVQAAKVRAADRVQRMSDVQQQIFAVLTPAQKAQVPQLLADMQQRMAARHAQAPGS